MAPPPWLRPDSVFLGAPIVIRTARRGYFHWAAGLTIALPITWWFWGMWSILPGEQVMQIAVSLMAGVDVWLAARIAELLVRRVAVDFSGLSYRSLLRTVTLRWDELERIEWWRPSRWRVSYRLWAGDRRPLATLGDDTWSHLPEGIGYAVARRGLEPVLIAPPLTEFVQVAILILMPLAVALFAFLPSDVIRIAGFLLVRIFWTALVRHYSRYELRTVQLYMLLLSVSVILTLKLVSGASFQATLLWWLYSPAIEAVVSFLVVELLRWWNSRKRLPGSAA